MKLIEKAARAVAMSCAGSEDPWRNYLSETRAVLLAVRKPDEAMIDAAYPLVDDPHWWPKEGQQVFTAMIDAILEDPK